MKKFCLSALFLLFCNSSLAAEDYSVVDYSKAKNDFVNSEIYEGDSVEISDDGNIIVYRRYPYDPGDYPDINESTWPLLIYAYNRTTNETVWVNRGLNGELPEKRLTDMEFAPSLCGNGRYVFFSSNANNLILDQDRNGYDIFRYDLELASLSCLTCGYSNIEDYTAPVCNEDGKKVIFTDGTYIFLFDADKNEAEIVVDKVPDGLGGEQSKGYYYDLSGNGRYIVVSATAKDLPTYKFGGGEKYREVCLRYDVETKEYLRVSGPEYLPSYLSGCSHPDISEDGNTIVFVATPYFKKDVTGHLRGIFYVNIKEGKAGFVSKRWNGANAMYAVISPGKVSSNGRYVIWGGVRPEFYYDQTTFNYVVRLRGFQVFLFDTQSKYTRNLTLLDNGLLSKSYQSYPSISGDGDNVSFFSWGKDFNDGNLSKIGLYHRILVGKIIHPNPNRVEYYESPRVTGNKGLLKASFPEVPNAKEYEVEILLGKSVLEVQKTEKTRVKFKLGSKKGKYSVRYSVSRFQGSDEQADDRVSFTGSVRIS